MVGVEVDGGDRNSDGENRSLELDYLAKYIAEKVG